VEGFRTTSRPRAARVALGGSLCRGGGAQWSPACSSSSASSPAAAGGSCRRVRRRHQGGGGAARASSEHVGPGRRRHQGGGDPGLRPVRGGLRRQAVEHLRPSRAKKIMIIPGSRRARGPCTEIAQADAALGHGGGAWCRPSSPTRAPRPSTTRPSRKRDPPGAYSAINGGLAPTTRPPTPRPSPQAQKGRALVFSLYGVTQQQADQVKIPYVNVDPYVLDAQARGGPGRLAAQRPAVRRHRPSPPTRCRPPS